MDCSNVNAPLSVFSSLGSIAQTVELEVTAKAATQTIAMIRFHIITPPKTELTKKI